MTASAWRRASESVFAAKSTNDAEKDASISQGRRLNQVLAAAGLGSRRQVEEFILEGRVQIDGRTVTNLAERVRVGEQKILVDGEALPKARPVYMALNKPKNTLCTNHDPSGRRRVVDFMPQGVGRLFPVGRLDQNSEGLILLTNDGALAERLTHPRFEVPKKYRVQVAGMVDYELVNALKRGVHIAEGIVQADEVTIHSRHKMSSILEITLTEGKNREIRRMLARVGHKVMQLKRIQVGSIKIGKLAPGESRFLTSQEVAELYRMADARPDAETLDVSALPPTLKPVEASQLAEREEAKRADAASKSRDGKRDGKREGKRDEKKRAKSDPNFTDAVRTQLRNGYGGVPKRRESADPYEGTLERLDDDAAERGSRRRKVRRDPEEETRTIGPKKFTRDEGDASPRDRFNRDASAGRRRERDADEFERGDKRGSKRGFRRDDRRDSKRGERSEKRARGERKTARNVRQGKKGGGGRGRGRR